MIESFNASAAESKDTDDNDRAESKKDSKKSVDKKKLGTFTAKNVLEAPIVHRTEERKASLWEELVRERSKKPHEAVPATAEVKPKEPSKAENSEQTESGLEKLEDNEKQEVVRRIAESRVQEIREAHTAETSEETEDAQDAASLALMQSVQQKLAEHPEAAVEEVLNEAEAATTARIQAEEDGTPPESMQVDADEQGKEEAGEAVSSESELSSVQTEGEIPLHLEANEDEDSATIVIPRGGTGNGGAGAGSRTGSGGAGGAGGAGGIGGGGGGMPPRTPGGGGGVPPRTPGGGMPPFGGAPFGRSPAGPNFNAAPAAAPGVSIEDLNRIVHRQERAAIAQGLLVGGIVGYLIGRRRGRIKTEKRLLPIQKNLEKQVEGLQAAVLERDQKVRSLAAEKARDMTSREERERFARRLAEAEAIRTQATERLEKRLAGKEATKKDVPRPLELGRMVVEAPAVVLSAASNSYRRSETGIEAPVAASLPKKKVEQYSTPELKQAAEKIRVDGTSVKEMWDRGQLSEHAVERIITEYIEGHSVRAALNKELFVEATHIELDPKLRQAAKRALDGGGGSNNTDTSGSSAMQAGAAMLLRTLSKSERDKLLPAHVKSNNSVREPETLAETLKNPKNQAIIAGTIAAITAIIVAVIIFT